MTVSLSKGERAAQAIADAAYALFIEQGFHATSMRQIARRAGVALGGIYNHFKSKEEIFDYVLLEKHPYHHILAILNSAPGNTVEEFVYNVADAVSAELNSRPDFLKLAFVELSEFKGRHTPRLFQTIFPQFIPLFERFGGTEGRLRDLPPQAVGMAFLALLVSFYMAHSMGVQGRALPSNTVTIQHFVHIFLHGILKPEQP